MTFFDIRLVDQKLDRLLQHLISSGTEGGHNYRPDIQRLEKLIMALDQNVQALIDQVANNTSLVNSALAALKVESDQIAALQAQIAAIQPGKPVDDEDLAAIQKAVSDLQATNAGLQQAVPASTPGV